MKSRAGVIELLPDKMHLANRVPFLFFFLILCPLSNPLLMLTIKGLAVDVNLEIFLTHCALLISDILVNISDVPIEP